MCREHQKRRKKIYIIVIVVGHHSFIIFKTASGKGQVSCAVAVSIAWSSYIYSISDMHAMLLRNHTYYVVRCAIKCCSWVHQYVPHEIRCICCWRWNRTGIGLAAGEPRFFRYNGTKAHTSTVAEEGRLRDGGGILLGGVLYAQRGAA